MKSNHINNIIGFIVIIFASVASYYFINQSDTFKNQDFYKVTAIFRDANGVYKGMNLKVSGVIIGKVEDISLNQADYSVNVSLSLAKNIKIPTDSSLKIQSSGLFSGEKFLQVEAGIEDKFLQADDVIMDTRGSINFDSLINKFLFKNKND